MQKYFGYGFYCTNLEKQAIKWAMTKRKSHVVNVYEYRKNVELKICSFPEMTEAWLDFVVNCRKGIEHEYDIVEGPMAVIQSGIILKISQEGIFPVKLSGHWLNSNIQPIKSYFVLKKLFQLLIMEGVTNYEKHFF